MDMLFLNVVVLVGLHCVSRTTAAPIAPRTSAETLLPAPPDAPTYAQIMRTHPFTDTPNMNVMEGERTQLNCRYTVEPSVVGKIYVKWYHAETLLYETSHNRRETGVGEEGLLYQVHEPRQRVGPPGLFSGQNITFLRARATDTGLYRCLVQFVLPNKSQYRASISMYLHVDPAPSKMLAPEGSDSSQDRKKRMAQVTTTMENSNATQVGKSIDPKLKQAIPLPLLFIGAFAGAVVMVGFGIICHMEYKKKYGKKRVLPKKKKVEDKKKLISPYVESTPVGESTPVQPTYEKPPSPRPASRKSGRSGKSGRSPSPVPGLPDDAGSSRCPSETSAVSRTSRALSARSRGLARSGSPQSAVREKSRHSACARDVNAPVDHFPTTEPFDPEEEQEDEYPVAEFDADDSFHPQDHSRKFDRDDGVENMDHTSIPPTNERYSDSSGEEGGMGPADHNQI